MSVEQIILSVADMTCLIQKRVYNDFAEEFKLDAISFNLSNYETLGLVGESGSGKTTLGRLITGALKATDTKERRIIIDGKVEFMGQHDYRNPKVRKSLNYPIQMIYQDPKVALNEFMEVRSQIVEAAEVGYEKVKTNLSKDDWINNNVNELLDIMMLDDIKNHYPFIMSGGQIRRLGVARVLAAQPKIIIADEPTASLDASTKNMVLNYLSEYTNRRENDGLPMGSIIISHDLETISRYCGKVLVMQNGQLVEKLKKDRKGIFDPRKTFTKKLWEDNAFFVRA